MKIFKFLALVSAMVSAQGAKDQQRVVVYARLPRIFNWYEELLTRFVGQRKRGKYIHRIGELKQKIYWEIDRCESAGPDAKEQAQAGLIEMGLGHLVDQQQRNDDIDLAELIDMADELDAMFQDSNYLSNVVDSFQYEDNDDLETPFVDTERKVGNRPNRPNRPNKNTPWKATSQLKNPMNDSVGKPPRVLLYKVNKTMQKWFKNFLPKTCKKFPRIFKRMKSLKKQITKLMPTHQYQFDDVNQ